ncbi:MAG TPA: GNAT family N-acetyltransferase [Terriglobales bacterium]|nr:GNAT family N-acetyltransferase [Terriglobales bacterium]
MLSIRRATVDDVDLILRFIRGLAEYEREPQAVVATREDLIRDGFTAEPRFHVLIAEWERQPAGFAFYFFNYSTWRGRAGLYLEDLFVHPELRGKGIGKALLAELAEIALQENCYGLRWEVLDWNTPAIDFYERVGAEVLKQWLPVRLTGEPLLRLAEAAAQSHKGNPSRR